MNDFLGEFPVKKLKDTPFANFAPKDWALQYIFQYGQIDGEHHKQWVLDQVARILKGAKVTVTVARWKNGHFEYRYTVGTSKRYEAWVEDYKDGGEYDYDEGIPP